MAKFGGIADLVIAIPAFLFFGAIFVLGPALLIGGVFGHLYSSSHAPNPAVNTDAHRRGFARAGVAGYLAR